MAGRIWDDSEIEHQVQEFPLVEYGFLLLSYECSSLSVSYSSMAFVVVPTERGQLGRTQHGCKTRFLLLNGRGLYLGHMIYNLATGTCSIGLRKIYYMT
jgi:hypothetical protein